MKRTINLTLLLFLAIFSFSCNTKSQETAVKVLTPMEFKEKSLNQLIIDIRTPQEFNQGHIQGAININYFDSTFLDQVSKYEKSTTLYLYCRSGNRTSSASSQITALGFKKVYDLQGGIVNWERNNLEVKK
ncbi:rhodanese-like domain-containing protein [Lutibacter sp.]|uniref:rhodanese-like domain-containing protein n=1 Tax=Lutibacter sp. TaxID=1925666 RepID=UPI002733EB0F|nr:rhodanese-like domain-containing protein [Lutibacter sp.]MDP3312066.1 rhodanese-like domain-containing protein [Lutibacter sp.]